MPLATTLQNQAEQGPLLQQVIIDMTGTESKVKSSAPESVRCAIVCELEVEVNVLTRIM